MKDKDFYAAEFTLSGDVADAGTFTVNYPTVDNVVLNAGDFENALGHYAMVNGDKLQQGEHLSLSFGASAVTVTNNTGATLPQGSKGVFQFQKAGQHSGQRIMVGTNRVTRAHLMGAAYFLIDFGSPKTLDADGLWDGVAAEATASTGDVTTMKAATANGGVLDVPRGLSLVGSAGADHVVTINGFDEYDEPMSETLTANGATPVNGVKAFKKVTDYAIAAGGAAGDTLDIGWRDLFGLPIKLTSQYQIVSEIYDGAYLKKLNDVELIQFQALEAEIDAGTSVWVVPGFAGSVLNMTTAVGDGITTGGAITLEIATVAVDGLSVTVADGSSAGDIDTDAATAGHATADFTATQALEVVFAAGFNASGRINGTIECRRTSVLQGTFVAGLAANTKSTATTADVRGTYAPSSAADGAVSFQLLVAVVPDVGGLGGNMQYAA